jgi:hypothetical protein
MCRRSPVKRLPRVLLLRLHHLGKCDRGKPVFGWHELRVALQTPRYYDRKARVGFLMVQRWAAGEQGRDRIRALAIHAPEIDYRRAIFPDSPNREGLGRPQAAT